jgi:outer membrane protein OmpA-like peptidoglycan-associated protein
MSTISYGEKDPMASNKTRSGRAQNRRVVLVVMA